MSAQLQQPNSMKSVINSVPSIQPEIWLNQPVSYVNELVSESVHYKVENSSSYNASTINFSFQPSPNFILPRDKVFVRTKFRVTLSGVDTGVPLVVLGVNDAPRFMPLQSVCSNTVLQLNGHSFSVESRYLVNQLFKLMDEQERIKLSSGAPNMMDFYQEYSDAVSQGFQRDPLSSVGSNSKEQTRAGFTINSAVITNTSAVIEFTSTEPLLCEPLCSPTYQGKKGLVGINNVQIALNLGNLSRVWSHSSAGHALTSISAEIVESPALLYQLQQQSMYVDRDVVTKWQYSKYDLMVSQSQSVAANATASFNLNDKKLASVPEAFIVWVQEIENNKSYLSSDSYARIENFTLNYNYTPYFTSASPQQLFELSSKNGLKMSFDQWYDRTGSMLVVRPENFGLAAGLSPGTQASTNLDFQVSVRNIGTAQKTYELRVISVNQGVLMLQDQTLFVQLAPLSREGNAKEFMDMMKNPAYVLPSNDYNRSLVGSAVLGGSMLGGAMLGGGIFDVFKKIARPALEVAKTLNPAKKGLELADIALKTVGGSIAQTDQAYASVLEKFTKKKQGRKPRK